MSTPLRAAVIGVGYLGRFHAQKYASLPDVELVGVVDAHPETARRVAKELGVAAFTDYRELLDAGRVDLVSVASTTETHHAVARDCLAAGVHVLAEKPITVTVAQADELVALADAKKLVLQVGHLERFNPAWLAVKDKITRPVFIEAHRMAPFKARGIDVSVVLDLMIHDLDLILPLVGSPVADLRASGVSVLTDGIDIANARIEFANGCVANLTASRTSTASLRRLRVFQHHEYISIDFGDRRIGISRKREALVEGEPPLDTETFQQPPGDALMTEIVAFVAAVRHGTPPVVSGREGRDALAIALEIDRMIAARQNSLS
ncbi:Gfo/Idh/MocA family protein [Sulfuritalea hydrogenivorans]|uniref:Oxidoreductase domain-containing protein n=1 Tax=Sulfuritalea hydrogenivorans sk43H TaxID=1223802 RepID=W0SE06_9PROT|nr:Gfo/Idh/MocA family oxidoreductase [Sulfuritalea hydrogenivorans]MDK9713868.1 Gfo/Idh/MocA family oxidoreductase [Sulfuritalea sp.]BAO27973.1 oxidoreductase domain-containing protein [Sulfuritalea hydrogenivorans sk43H]